MSIKWSELHSSNIKMIDNNDTLGGRNATDKNLTRYREERRGGERRAPGLTNICTSNYSTNVHLSWLGGKVERELLPLEDWQVSRCGY